MLTRTLIAVARGWPALALGAVLACQPSAEVKKRMANLEAAAAQKDSLMQEIALSTRLISDISAELAKVQVTGGRLKVSAESPAAAARDTMVQKVRYMITRVNESEAQLRSSRRRVQSFSHLSDSLRASLDSTLTNLQGVINSQKEQLAALSDQVNTLETENVALKDTVSNMSQRENTVYYVIGTKDQLLSRGLLTEEGGSRFLFLLWKRGKTVQPARDLDPSAFHAINKREMTDIPLPQSDGAYRIVSRQDLDYLATRPDPDGRITGTPALRIASPEQFWRNSKFLIIVQERAGAHPAGAEE